MLRCQNRQGFGAGDSRILHPGFCKLEGPRFVSERVRAAAEGLEVAGCRSEIRSVSEGLSGGERFAGCPTHSWVSNVWETMDQLEATWLRLVARQFTPTHSNVRNEWGTHPAIIINSPSSLISVYCSYSASWFSSLSILLRSDAVERAAHQFLIEGVIKFATRLSGIVRTMARMPITTPRS